jgi:flagellar basal-body rod protein FlgC
MELGNGDLGRATVAARSGLAAESLRMRIIAENIANQDSTGQAGGSEPYRRRLVTFRTAVDASGATTVAAGNIVTDPTPFPKHYQPGHPTADAAGYVRTANVQPIVEQADMRAAQRAYEANVAAVEGTRGLVNKTLELLK